MDPSLITSAIQFIFMGSYVFLAATLVASIFYHSFLLLFNFLYFICIAHIFWNGLEKFRKNKYYWISCTTLL